MKKFKWERKKKLNEFSVSCWKMTTSWKFPITSILKKGSRILSGDRLLGSNSYLKQSRLLTWSFLSSFSRINSPLLQPKNSIPIRKHYTYLAWSSLREHPVFSALVSSFTRGGRKATTGNTSAVRRLTHFLTRWNREYTIQYLVIKQKTSSSLKSWFTSEKEHADHGVPPFTFDSFFINKRYC